MNLVEILRSFGLKSYEASAYATLAALGEATAGEISRKAGIPRTKIYEVLYSLVERGFAEIQPGIPATFRAVEPAKIAARLQREFNQRVERMLRAFEELKVEGAEEKLVWISRGKWAVDNRLREFLRESREISVFCITETFVDVLREIGGVHRVLLYQKFRIPEKVVNYRILNIEKLKNSPDGLLVRFSEIIDGTVGERPEIIAISNEKSIIAIQQGREVIALSIHLPLIVELQRRMFNTLYELYCL